MKRYISSIICAGFLMLTIAAWAEEPRQISDPVTKHYTECFAAWDNDLHSLQTGFTQTTTYDGTPISTSQGRIYYAQMGTMLRLDTLEQQTVTQSALTNKKQIYILDDKGKEIARVSWAEWLLGQPNQPLFDFGNYTQLLQKHTVSLQPDKKSIILKLTPKVASENYLLYVTINKENCFPQKITIESDLMQTSAELFDTKINQLLSNDLFKGLK